MHSAQRGIRFFVENDQLPQVLDVLIAKFAPRTVQKATFTASASFNADKDGGGNADAKIDMDVTAVVKGGGAAPADLGAGFRATYDNQGEVRLGLVVEFG